jgi:AmmeMemoRadiSam system protein A
MAISQDLLRLARESIQEEFTHKKTEINAELKKKYSDKKGAFVTLTKNKDLRGCIGIIEPKLPLWQTIYTMAKEAALNDPRFPALTQEELSKIKVEISVLTIPTLLKADKPEEYITQIKIGRDGLIAEGDGCRGLLLPQVFPEWNADARGALDMTCEKAGLKHDAWRNTKLVKIYKFQCEIIHE